MLGSAINCIIKNRYNEPHYTLATETFNRNDVLTNIFGKNGTKILLGESLDKPLILMSLFIYHL